MSNTAHKSNHMLHGKINVSSEIWQENDIKTFAAPEQIKLHYDRARSICEAAGLTSHDVATLSPKFWAFHLDPFISRDTAALTILTIHWNLCMGSLTSVSQSRPDLVQILKELEEFKLCGEFMLTEIGHGLDARNLETLVHQQSDGSFILHTPTFEAAKVMPSSTPYGGIPKVAIVFARLIVKNHDCGVKPFLVHLTDGQKMCEGITSKLLPIRAGAKPIDHAITFFENVKLEHTALLGQAGEADNQRLEFLMSIWRVAVGTLALSLTNIPCLDICALVKEHQSYNSKLNTNLLSMRLLAHGSVFRDYANWSIGQFTDSEISDWRINHAIACIFKTTTQVTQTIVSESIERLGWQGLYGYNQLIEQMLSLRGNSVAEGDVLTFCIRLASESFRGKYRVPESHHPDCLLARHEAGLLHEAQTSMASFKNSHNGDDFNLELSTRCRPYVEAVGQRMAYEAALDAGTSPELLKVYEMACIKSDLAWYIENECLTRQQFHMQEDEALQVVLPLLDNILQRTQVQSVITAPIVNDQQWRQFVEGLPHSTTTTRPTYSVKSKL